MKAPVQSMELMQNLPPTKIDSDKDAGQVMIGCAALGVSHNPPGLD